MNYLTVIDLAPPGGFKGIGPLGLETKNAADSIKVFSKFLTSAIGLMSVIAIIWFIFLFIAGAYGYMAAGGDKKAIESATKKISAGLIGLALVVFAIFVVGFIGRILGITSILNIENLFYLIIR